MFTPLRSWGGWGTGQAFQTFLLHSWGHAFLPPCLSLVTNYFRLAKSGRLGSQNPPIMSRGQSPGQETHSTHRIQRVLVNSDRDNQVTSWATNHPAVEKQKARSSLSMGHPPSSAASQNCVERRGSYKNKTAHIGGLRASRKISPDPPLFLLHICSPHQGSVPHSNCMEDNHDQMAVGAPSNHLLPSLAETIPPPSPQPPLNTECPELPWCHEPFLKGTFNLSCSLSLPWTDPEVI